MAMGRNLLDDVTISELQQMREQGMSNQDIADALGVNYQTIYKYLGKQPKGLRKQPEYKEPEAEKVEEPAPEACLVVQNRTVELHGTVGQYTIDCKKGHVLIDIGDDEGMLIDLDSLNDFVSELRAIQRKVSELTVKNEMW